MAEPQSAVEALQAAVIALLRAAGPVTDLAGQRIYDEVPADTDRPQPPYVFVGGVNRSRIETGCGPVWSIRMRLFAVGTEFGRLKVWQLIEAMIEALDQAEPAFAGRWRRIDRIAVVTAGDVIEPFDPKSAFLDLSTIIAPE